MDAQKNLSNFSKVTQLMTVLLSYGDGTDGTWTPTILFYNTAWLLHASDSERKVYTATGMRGVTGSRRRWKRGKKWKGLTRCISWQGQKLVVVVTEWWSGKWKKKLPESSTFPLKISVQGADKALYPSAGTVGEGWKQWITRGAAGKRVRGACWCHLAGLPGHVIHLKLW